MSEFDEAVKEALEDIKSQVCAAKEIIINLDGQQLSVAQRTLLKNALDSALMCMTLLLNPSANPSFDPPDAGKAFTPIDTSGYTLADYARSACQQACDALDEYCEKQTDQGARHVRRLNAMIFDYYAAAGLT